MIPRWIIGVTLSFAGCCLSNTGVNVQKLAHSRKAGNRINGSVYLSPLWIAGFMSVVIGSICDLVAFSFASMSLLAPLGAMTLVINLATAPLFHDEHLTRRDVGATATILTGTILCISFGSKAETTTTLPEMAQLFLRTLFIVYVIVAFAYTGVVASYLHYYKRMKSRNQVTARMKYLHSFVFPTLAGLCGGHSVLFAKACGQIVIQTSSGDNQFAYWGTYMLFMLLGGFLFLQVKFLNMGLIRANALLVVPVYQVSWVVANATVGMVYWRDFEAMNALGISFFFIGIAIAFAGVYLLASVDQSDTALRAVAVEIPVDDTTTDNEYSPATLSSQERHFSRRESVENSEGSMEEDARSLQCGEFLPSAKE